MVRGMRRGVDGERAGMWEDLEQWKVRGLRERGGEGEEWCERMGFCGERKKTLRLCSSERVPIGRLQRIEDEGGREGWTHFSNKRVEYRDLYAYSINIYY